MGIKSITIGGKCMRIQEHIKYNKKGKYYIVRTIHTNHFDVLVAMMSLMGYKLKEDKYMPKRKSYISSYNGAAGIYFDCDMGWIITDRLLRQLDVDV